ncbi:MAG TPA: family 20 glycosylhydrolase, partial [Bacteroidales bacterium]|nr:family 20 glycosylhydrolase [Bacteroidales bacterium]
MRTLLSCLLISWLPFFPVYGNPGDSLTVTPRPAEVKPGKGVFLISSSTLLQTGANDQEAARIGQFLAQAVRGNGGPDLALAQGGTVGPGSSVIRLKINPNMKLPEEGYELSVTTGGITLLSKTPAGLFRGVQTLSQMLPGIPGQVTDAAMEIPCVRIRDYPRFPYRGMHLDVSRHFFPKEFILRYIDLLAHYRMNTFHWHLCDDNGWRIEIKKYPELTKISAWRVDHEDKPWTERPAALPGEKATYGGFYTQEDIREVVKYAADRFITVIPEIEMPAHAVEVLAAYPRLSCTGGPFAVPTGSYWPNNDIYSAGNDSVFTFLEDVLKEVMDLFPSKYIHIGGDEADKTNWKKCPKCQARMTSEGLKDEKELQSYFMRRIEKFIVGQGRKVIGWDEILEGGLGPEATVMSWRGVEGGIAAARQGHDAIMTPTSYCYLDYYQADKSFEPPAIGGFVSLKKVYSYEPVPEELWNKVADYCDNDVIATEATYEDRKSDFTARQILADLAGLTVNDTTNTLTTKIIFGGNKNPQNQFNYRNMGEVTPDASRFVITKDMRLYDHFGDEFTIFNEQGQPIFPGYKFDLGKSTYRGEEVGEGGYVYSRPGAYGNVALLDVASMHPSSIVAENLFGDEYTARFKDILDARIAIKSKNYEKAKTMLNGALAKYLDDPSVAKDVATALKIAINSVYGLTSAGFNNPFRDERNRDNIVAKRGALFMINLRHEVETRGFEVAHIKTDSIKVPDATPEIINFICDYGRQYGYNFVHEATYDKMCLVNDAVYIAKYASIDKCKKFYPYIPDENKDHEKQWTATGTQFAVPYVFKKLFSKEDIQFEDMCETKAVTSALYLDLNEGLGEDEHRYHFIGRVGLFCPIKEGCGGGLLLREATSKTGEVKYAAATGSKGYRWLEAEMVQTLGKQKDIDTGYYENLVDDAADSLSRFAELNWLLSDDE